MDEIAELQVWIDEHSGCSRYRLAHLLCERWQWYSGRGMLKTFAARNLMLKLEQRYGLRLPALQEHQRRQSGWTIGRVTHPEALGLNRQPLNRPLPEVQPLIWRLILTNSDERERAYAYLRFYHYLGLNRPVGESLLYLVSDCHGHDLAVVLVGAAAWKCGPRDRFIGWDATQRAERLHLVANNQRFLILPWVKVPYLASHLLAQLAKRLSRDWPQQYAHPIYLIESFVELGRFVGTAYRAANWRLVGQTTGRTRQNRTGRAQAPIKAVYLYPLQTDFRRYLNSYSE
jgi:hypothetical protein